MITGIDMGGGGLDLRDPRGLSPGALRAALNVLPTGGALRSVPGYECLSNTVYAGGTNGKLALWLRKFVDVSSDTAMLLATRQAQTTGTASATVAGYLVDAAVSPFTPAFVGRVVKNTTDGTFTVIVGYVNQWTVELADDIFAAAENYAVYQPGDTVAGIWYSTVGVELPTDLTVLGEINDTGSLFPVSIQGRIVLLSGEERGNVLHGTTFRPMALRNCQDNNSLSVDVSQAGNHTGKYKFKLCFYDVDTYRVSPELLIEDSTTDDGYFDLSAKKVVLNTATLPTNTTDTWSHYRLYVKKDEWADYHFGAEIAKAAGSFEENLSDPVLLARETLVENRIAPSGFLYGLEWDNRLILWGHHGLEVSAGASISNGSDLVTLGGGVTAEEWMRGSRIYIAAAGGDLLHGYDVKDIVDSTTLQLWSEWSEATVASGDARIAPYPSRITVCLGTYADAEFTSPWHFFDVNPDDGDQVVTCFVHGGDLYVLKRRSMWRVSKSQIIDQTTGGLFEPAALIVHIEEVATGVGCCGPRAIATDGRGVWYWLAGVQGLMRFAGGGLGKAPGHAQVDPYWEEQDEDDFWGVTINHNPQWGCMEVQGLQRPALVEPVAPEIGIPVGGTSVRLWEWSGDPDNYYIDLFLDTQQMVWVIGGAATMVFRGVGRVLRPNSIREQPYDTETVMTPLDSPNGEIEYDSGNIAIGAKRTSDGAFVKVAELSAVGRLRCGAFREDRDLPYEAAASPSFSNYYEWFDSPGVLDFTTDLLRTLIRFERVDIGGVTNARLRFGSYRERGV